MSEERREDSIGPRLPEIREPGPLNIINVNPSLVSELYTHALLRTIVSSDRESVPLQVEEGVRQYLSQRATPVSIASVPMSISSSFITAVNTLVELYRMRCENIVKRAKSIVKEVMSGNVVEIDGMKVTIDNLHVFMKHVGRTLEIEKVAFQEALERLAALYTLNLPPQYRSAIINMIVEGIDVLSVEQKRESEKEIQELLRALQQAQGERTRRTRRRRTRKTREATLEEELA